MIGVILLQLGTPDAPTTAALKRYLREFLSDRRVVDLPRALWWPVLHGIVLRTRPRRSARLYQKIWRSEGSPLRVITRAQAAGLEQRLAGTVRGTRIRVVAGMRYGRPSIAEALAQLFQAGVSRILAFPMYPQYASATTGSGLQQLLEDVRDRRVIPPMRVVPPYYDDPGYIAALADVAREALAAVPERPNRLLLSFHGLPKRFADLGDPYPGQCRATAELLESSLGAMADSVTLVYQSSGGRDAWLEPYTDKTLEALGKAGAGVAVMCPGFTADCLETLEEIRLRGYEQFRSAGGRDYLAIPCLNEHPAWLDAMTAIARRELAGWI
jgi:ferrochelatase